MNDEWIEWKGGKPPVKPNIKVEVLLENGDLHKSTANNFYWGHHGDGGDIVGYRIIDEAAKPHGGKLSGKHYYRVDVSEPISPELSPYSAECADIIEALGMTFNEGECFKALWRMAAARQGNGNPGADAQYDADKVAHYGQRVAAQTKRGGSC